MNLMRILGTALLCTALVSPHWAFSAAADALAATSGIAAVSPESESTSVHKNQDGDSKSRPEVAMIPRKTAAAPKPRPLSGVVASSRGESPNVRSNAALRSLLSARAHGRLPPRPSRSVGPSDMTHRSGVVARGPTGASSAGGSSAGPSSSPGVPPRLAPNASGMTLRLSQPASSQTVSIQKLVASRATLGAQHLGGPVQVGGPAMGRTARGTILDAGQLHHKF